METKKSRSESIELDITVRLPVIIPPTNLIIANVNARALAIMTAFCGDLMNESTKILRRGYQKKIIMQENYLFYYILSIYLIMISNP